MFFCNFSYPSFVLSLNYVILMTTAEYNSCVKLHADSVYRFILKNLRDEERSRDIVQDAFEKMWLNVENISPDKSKAYLFTTAYRTMIDSIRRSKFTTPMDEMTAAYASDDVQYSDLSEILNNAIAKLPEDQRIALLLRDYEGYSYKEIEDITGMNESQVKVYIYRARVFLKNFIGCIEKVL